jgi:hypothetical protein
MGGGGGHGGGDRRGLGVRRRGDLGMGGKNNTPRLDAESGSTCSGLDAWCIGAAEAEHSGGVDELAPDRAQANSFCSVEGLQQEKK